MASAHLLNLTSNDRERILTATAGQTDFSTDFPVMLATDLQVSTRASSSGAWTVATFGVDYSVLDAGSTAGATARFTVARAAGSQVRLLGLATISRTESVVTSGQFRSDVIDKQIDRGVIIDQELRRDLDASAAGLVAVNDRIDDLDDQVAAAAASAAAAAQDADDAEAARLAAEAAQAAAEAAAALPPTAMSIYADVATLGAANVPVNVNRVSTQFHNSALPQCGGGAAYRRLSSIPSPLRLYHVVSNGGTVAWELDEKYPNVAMFGARNDLGADAQPAFAAANLYKQPCFVPKGRYKLDSGVPLSDGMQFYGVRGGQVANPTEGSVLVQYGQQAFVGDENLEYAVVSGFAFDLQATSITAYTVALALKAHRYCIFENFYFVRYTGATIIERIPLTATLNTIDNVYRNWLIENCVHIAISVGQDGWYHRLIGNGSTTVINTGMSWPELFSSSVVVFRENFNRNFTQMTLGTDYSVSYPGGILVVTMASAPLTTDRIWIFPSQPRADAATGKQRRPISNNRWEDIKTNFGIDGHGFMDCRWVDYEIYNNVRLHLNNNGVRGFFTNPGLERTCEAGDFNQYYACLVSYMSGVTDIATIWGWWLGPGSLQMAAYGAAADFTWVDGSGVNHTVNNQDKELVVLSGTVTATNGSTAVTGSGTKLTEQLTLVGDSLDTVVIDGVIYGIASINSATSITLATNFAGTTGSGKTITRKNSKNGNSYVFDFASMGGSSTPPSGNTRRGVGRATYKSSTEFVSAAIIAAGQTSVVIPHTLWRAPNPTLDKVTVLPTNASAAAASVWFSAATASSITLNCSPAAAATLAFAVHVELVALQ